MVCHLLLLLVRHESRDACGVLHALRAAGISNPTAGQHDAEGAADFRWIRALDQRNHHGLVV